MKPLFNGSETITFEELESVASEWGLRVFPKIRVADILPIEGSGIDDVHYSYALKAHFDYVVVRNHGKEQLPEFAVEFDGPTHRNASSRIRDDKKNYLCKQFGFPLLRIRWAHISRKYRYITALAWIISVYELKMGFEEAQDKGQVPYDEVFDPSHLSVSSKPHIIYPYCMSHVAQTEVKSLFEAGRLAAPGSSGFIGYDNNGLMSGIEYVPVTGTGGLYVKSAIRAQDFPVPFEDLLREVLCVELYEELQGHFDDHILLQPMDVIRAKVGEMRNELELVVAHDWRFPAVQT